MPQVLISIKLRSLVNFDVQQTLSKGLQKIDKNTPYAKFVGVFLQFLAFKKYSKKSF